MLEIVLKVLGIFYLILQIIDKTMDIKKKKTKKKVKNKK